jgi:hypothetical protein
VAGRQPAHPGARGLDQQGAELLRKAISIEPNNADVQHSLGLLLVRQHDYAGALHLLRRASELAPVAAHSGVRPVWHWVHGFGVPSETDRPGRVKRTTSMSPVR